MATGRTLTNNCNIQFVAETSLGVLPGSPVWSGIEPNANISKWGADIKITPRDPISRLRQRRKGEVTDLDSDVELEADVTMDSIQDLANGLYMSAWKGAAVWQGKDGTAPTAITATAITVPTLGVTLPQNALVYLRGFLLAANQGIKVVGAGSTATNIVITGGAVETPPANASVEYCGFQLTAADGQLDASGNFTCATLNLTTLPLNVGQYVCVGDSSSATFYFASGVPATGANYGLSRVDVIAAGKLTLSRRSGTGTWTVDTGTGKTIRLLFGRWIRNVASDHADALTPSYQFEIVYKDLGGAGVDFYEYPLGNWVDKLEINIPLTNKATLKYGLMGTNTLAPTASRATNAAAGRTPTRTAELATVGDVARLRLMNTDESGLTTDFKSIKIALNNNVTREKVIGTLGAKYMAAGNFEVDVDAECLFTNFDVIVAMLANRTAAIDYCLKNADGGFVMDLPALMLGGNKKTFPKNESVRIGWKGMSFVDPVLGYSTSLSIFPYLPI